MSLTLRVFAQCFNVMCDTHIDSSATHNFRINNPLATRQATCIGSRFVHLTLKLSRSTARILSFYFFCSFFKKWFGWTKRGLSSEKLATPSIAELTDGERVSLKLLTIIDPGDQTSNFIDLAEIIAVPLRAFILCSVCRCLFLTKRKEKKIIYKAYKDTVDVNASLKRYLQ